MTFDEIQRTLEQMLAVQRDLQNSQLALKETQEAQSQEIQAILAIQRDLQNSQLSFREAQEAQRQEIQDMLEHQKRQESFINRLIGYSLTNESDHLDLEEKFNALEERMRRLEER